MLSLYSVLVSKPWHHPENMKGTMGMHQKSGALLPRSAEWSRPRGSSVRGPRGVLATARVLVQWLGARCSILCALDLGHKEKLTTNCDGSAYTENGRNDREHFDGSYRVQHGSVKSWSKFMLCSTVGL